MKYLIKNVKTGEETLCKKVVVDGFDCYVNNEEIPDECYYVSIENDFYTEPKERYVLYVKSTGLNGENPRKVIATNNKSLDLPQVVDEVGELAKSEHKYNHKSVQEIGFRLGFEMGYKQTKETYQFTKEDMVELLNWVYKNASKNKVDSWEMWKDGNLYHFGSEKLFKIWQQQRTIKVEVE